MRVLYVTTWGTSCGIATYTEELVEASIAEKLFTPYVFGPAEPGSGIRPTVAVPFTTGWLRTGVGLTEALLQQVERVKPDVVHFQHEDGLFTEPTAFLRAARAVRRHCAVVVTLHTVQWAGGWEQSLWTRDLGQCVDEIVAHLPEAAAALGLYAPHIDCVPHGTGPIEQGDKERGITALHIDGPLKKLLLDPDRTAPVVLLYGFIGPGKNLICSLRGIASTEAKRFCESHIILLVGETKDERYIRELQWLITHAGLEPRAIVRPEFLPVADVPHVFALADYGIVNTHTWTLSASGAAHVFARHGVPLAAAQRPIYFEAHRGGALAFDLGQEAAVPTGAMLNCIGGLASSPSLRAHVRASMRAWAEQTAWPRVAQRHLTIYNKVLARRREEAQHVAA